jgi:competence protein ComEA
VVTLPPRHIVLYAVGALAILAFAVRAAVRDEGTSKPTARAAAPIRVERAAGERLTIHVAGAVHRPGVYRMRQGSRVDDAIDRAGGARERADLGALNLAAELEDGRQVLVPRRPPTGSAGQTAGPVAGAAPTAPPAAAAGGAAAATGAPPGPPINLNTATIEQLDQLEGIGPTTAQKILQYRQEHGGFSSVEELKNVPGIGDTRYATLKERVTA